jgi:ABC-2 type transport system permease protein
VSLAAQQRHPAARSAAEASAGGWSEVYAVEVRKFSSQLQIRLLALVCVLAPFVAGALIKVQGGSPTDTLYGVWVHSSGFALSLFILGFAGSWIFPLVAGIVAGDLFSAEDRYGTWKLVLTRSCTRGEVFAGKLLAAASVTTGLVVLTTLASLVAGAAMVGPHALVSLNGHLIPAGKSLLLVLASWLLCLLPTLAFASIAALLSIATRNGIIGVVGTVLIALIMQLLVLVGSGVWAHMILVGSAFITWHALFLDHSYLTPLLFGIAMSVVWSAACLWVAWLILRRRDFAGQPVGRRVGWVAPARGAVAIAAVVVLFALAGSWGPVGVTAKRLRASFVPTFNNLTVLQQTELGRKVAPGAHLNIALPSCSRRGSKPDGPGDWVCTMQIIVPSGGSLPPEPTTVSYDISVESDGCYKAQSPPIFIGQQLMKGPDGSQIVNPLYTIYGCFDPL